MSRIAYRLAVDLWYPTDPRLVRRIAGGENPPLAERKMRHGKAGEIVSDLPGPSVPWLLAKGKIAPVGEPVLLGKDEEGDDDGA